MNFDEKLQFLRKQKKLSQEDLAEILGASKQTILQWESGQATPEIDKIVKLSDLFNVSTDFLLKPDDIHEHSKLYENISEVDNTIVTAKNTNTKKLLGMIFLIFGIISFLTFWIMSMIFPTSYYFNRDVHYGLIAFVLDHKATLFFAFCCIVGIVGLGLVISDYSKNKQIK